MWMRYLVGTFFLLGTGCNDQSIQLGLGAPPDARLISDVFTWECQDPDTEERYDGVFAHDITFEYAPDALVDRALPAAGCTRGVDIFPSDAGAGGTDVPKVSGSGWSSENETGVLDRESIGYYHDSVLRNQSDCSSAEDLLAQSTSLTSMGPFSGASTPAVGSLSAVTLVGEVDDETGIPFGSEVTASWSSEGWDSAWVQIRREKEGALMESVTCSVGNDQRFTLNDDVWSLLSEELAVDLTNLYVAVQSESTTATADGQEIVSYTRAMHVAVVQD